jgi:putative membrane protein
VELVPQPLQDVYFLLPMTYTVEGVHVLISTGDFELLRNDTFILTFFLLVSAILTWHVVEKKRAVSPLPTTS